MFFSIISFLTIIQNGCASDEEIFVDYGDLSQSDSESYSVYYEWPSVINFDFDEYHFGDEEQLKLDKVVYTLLSNAELKVVLIGSVDPEGSNRYNQKLAKNRALTVAEYLINNGVMRNRIMITSSGSFNSYLKTTVRSENIVNRRVQMILLGADSNPVEMMYEVIKSD